MPTITPHESDQTGAFSLHSSFGATSGQPAPHGIKPRTCLRVVLLDQRVASSAEPRRPRLEAVVVVVPLPEYGSMALYAVVLVSLLLLHN